MFYGISSIIHHLMPILFLYKGTVLFQTIQFSSQINCQKKFLFQTIQFSQTVLIQTIQFSINTVLMSKTVLFHVF